MENDLETLEQQTAPESTRGLFDPPEQTPPPSSSGSADKRRSFHAFGPAGEARHPPSRQHQRGHQRSKSATSSDMVPNQGGSRRNTNFGLHTLAEEEDGRAQRDEQSVTVDSLQDMINTLKSLPPYNPKEEGGGSGPPSASVSTSRRGSRKFMGPTTSTSSNRHLSHSGGASNRNSGIDIQSLLPLPAEAKSSDRRRSSVMRMRASSISEQEEDAYVSREAALAEAEAKLMGTYTKRNSGDDENPEQSFGDNRRLSDMAGFNGNISGSISSGKHMSLQLPTVTENQPLAEPRSNRRISFNKPLSLGNDSNKVMNRRSSQYDWRSSASAASSPRTASYRHSFNLVPFTPTRVNFTRDDANPHQRRPLFIAHLPFSALTPLFRSRQLVRGMLRVNKRNRSDAYVSCDDLDADIYVCGSRDRNRALEGDVVAIRLVDVEKVLREKKEKEEAKLARNGGQPKVRLPDEEDENEIIFGGDSDVDTVKPKYCGVVVAILERAQNQVFSGTLTLMRPNNKRAQEEKAAEEAQKAETGQAPKKEAPRIVWFKATDKRVPLIAIPIEQAPEDFVDNPEAYANRLFVGSIKRWPITSLHPFGTLERELGRIEDLDVQTQAILADNNVTDTEFSEAVRECLPSIPYEITAEDLENRREINDVRIFTLADAKSKVLDNAISIQKIGEDIYDIGIHVSDVAHFIKPHSPMDKEARARAVRVELIHRFVPILPTELTEKVTNLVANEKRLSFSVVYKMSSAGKILDTWFGKTVITPCANISYDDAQNVIDSGTLDKVTDATLREGLEQDIRTLYSIATQLHETRYIEGGMSQMRQELAFEFDNKHEPTSIAIAKKKPSQIITKEFFLIANQSVAQRISSHFPEQALLRRHAPPDARKIRELEYYVSRYLNVPIDISSAGAIERSIESVQDPNLRKALSVMVLKTMQPPKYFCTGTLDILKYAHYALNAPLFTHFTSPSSRFSDIIVHRQLEATLSGEKRFYLDRDTVQKLAQHCNVKKEAAIYAREQSVLMWLAVYLNHRGVKQPDSNVTTVRKEAIVVAVFDQFFDVMIPELNLERRIHLANLPVWRSEFDPEKRALTMYWKKGVDTTTGKQRPWSLSDDEDEEDVDEEAILAEMQAETNGKVQAVASTQPQTNGVEAESSKTQETQQPPNILPEKTRSTSKRASMLMARLSDSTAYSADQASQTIMAMDKIQVLVSIEMVKTPPLIRVLGANPYA